MFVATLHYRPFAAPHIGRLELCSLSTAFMTLWLGSFFWATKNPTASMYISILIVVINVVFMLYLMVVLVGDAFRDYEVVKKVKFYGRKTYLRASTLTSRSSRASSTRASSTRASSTSSTKDAEMLNA